MPTLTTLVTGGDGFVGQRLRELMRSTNPDVDVRTASRKPLTAGREALRLDVMDGAAVGEVIRELRPAMIVHLAGMTSSRRAAEAPRDAWSANLTGTLNIVDAILEHSPQTRLLHVSTSEVYGLSANAPTPLDEDSLLQPATPYAVTKAAADLAVGEAAARGVKVLRMRPFNHTGPGQGPDFVIPRIAKQIAAIEAGHAEPILHIGRLDVSRDFTDVRDIVRGYVAAMERFDELPNGACINLASGVSRTIAEVLDEFLSLSSTAIRVKVDQDAVRPSDVPSVRACVDRAKAWLGWRAVVPLPDTLLDTLNYWRGLARADAT